MTLDILRHRLHNQFLSRPVLTEPGDVVQALGAVQSQDYAGAKWAFGLRLAEATDAALDEYFNRGKILRTHILRPTWHFVKPEDIRWMLALTAPRVHAANAFMYRQLELDRSTLRKSYKVLEGALRGGKQLTRAELGSALVKSGIPAQGLRLGYFMMSAELDGVLCSGARRGKQFTYALLEERAPQAKRLHREEALAELAGRYFATRGPATLQDFTWWSGLTMADAKNGIELLRDHFVSERLDGKTYWFDDSVDPGQDHSPTVHLLPNYDEYFIGFKDRRGIEPPAGSRKPAWRSSILNAPPIILDGRIAGSWRRALKKDAIFMELSLLAELTRAQKGAVAEAAERYARFLGLPAEIAI